MEPRAIGLIELSSIAVGMQCADDMVKAASVELIMARTICPGKYLAMVAGEVAAVQNSVAVGLAASGEFLIDTFVIPNVHPSVFPAISCATLIPKIRALGVIETYSVAACVIAADAAVKAAEIELIELRLATGVAGKAFVTLTGEVAPVRAAVEAGLGELAETGLVLSWVVIPAPSEELNVYLV